MASLNPTVAEVSKVKKSLKKGKPASFQVKGRYPGYAIISVKVKLKKKIKGKKEYDLRLHAYIKENPMPTATPTATPIPTAAPTAAPIPTAEPTATVTPMPSPTFSVAPSSKDDNLTAEEIVVYNRIMAKKNEYPQGMTWTDDNVIKWYAFFYEPKNMTITARGCVGFACLLSDAAFGECTSSNIVAPARQIDAPAPGTIRIGDIIRFNGNSHSAVIIGIDGDSFTLAEGNYNRSVNWGRKIPKSTKIDFVWTRWGASGVPAATAAPAETEVPDADYYTVTYTHNLGSDAPVMGMPDPLVVKVSKSGEHKLTLPSAPHCDGYSFDSWIYQNDYRKAPGAVVNVDKDMTIKARFVRDPGYIIQYETGVQKHPEIRGVVSGTTVPYGGTLTITSVKPSWEGHTFSGWSLSGDDTIYQPGQKIKNISSNLTFYAVWDVTVTPEPAEAPDPKEIEVLNRMLEMKSSYPEGMEYPAGEYKWYYGTHFSYMSGSGAFCAQLMDAGFQSENALNKGIDFECVSFGLKTYPVKIGDIFVYSEVFGGTKLYAIVLEVSGDEFTVAEANEGIVHWNTTMSRPKNLIGIYTRW